MNTIVFAGALDISRYPDFHEAFRDYVAIDEPLVIDLGEVTLVDSTFLTELLIFARRTDRPRAPIGIVVTHPGVLRVFTIARLTDRLRLYTSAQEAVAGLERESQRSDIFD
ncbi:MAG: hypothetical protein NVSMB5_19220 [Candidatus Velthaea sp.]